MSQHALESFGAYCKARELFYPVVSDMVTLGNDPGCYRLVAQPVSNADSVCSNIEEGYGRLSRNEYPRFLDFARESARETRARYERLNCRLSVHIIHNRVGLAVEIIAILTKTISALQQQLQNRSTISTSCLKDEDIISANDSFIPPLDTRISALDTPILS